MKNIVLALQMLFEVGHAKVASMIKGKTTEEIRKQFNIVNDFTPEDEAQVRGSEESLANWGIANRE